MARAIDGELLELEIANIANKLAKSDAQKALMGRVMYCVEHMPTLTPPNKPLTLEQLREMDGEPVYMVDLTGGTLWDQWIIFERHTYDGFIPRGGGYFGCASYGGKWLAYRRPPEGEV
ncbi:hypothetical protein [Flavonifractor plautii]|uniref:hypothetical protein n=1 Tax=Flavonifractor plautii TaxID=292800 RepID=UPI00214BD218|nr:hypothetical protein [Flavonifractor plautii]MCR1907473.1 hypothetical protein [Flavonifractor plautii]